MRGCRLSLLQQFALASLIVMGTGMALLGMWVSSRIEAGVVHNAAVTTAFYMDSFVEPKVQDLASARQISDEQIAALDALRAHPTFAEHIVSFKIWVSGGRIVYSSSRELIGQVFPSTPKLRQAWAGHVAAEFDNLIEEENVGDRALHLPLVEIYSPLHEEGTGRIIAVGEFYAVAKELQSDLRAARRGSWLAISAGAMVMFAALFGIVQKGSRTIEAQRGALEHRVAELSALLAQNAELRTRIDEANRRMAIMNERALQRVGTELHDGLAQLVSLSLVRLDTLASRLQPMARDAKDEDVLETVRAILRDALNEIRNLLTGLSLPELENVPIAKALEIAAKAHARRTGTRVCCDIGELPVNLPMALKVCLYRFTQEGLNNAFRHAGAAGQTVVARLEAGSLLVEVADSGTGFAPDASQDGGGGIGLTGLRDRINSLGGTFDVRSSPGAGTRVSARFETVS